MPLYEYSCKSCGQNCEALQKLSDPFLVECPHCGKDSLKRQVSATRFQLKGTGWYATDFKNSGKAPEAQSKKTSDISSPETETKTASTEKKSETADTTAKPTPKSEEKS